ncbi:PTS sugar transporter subunit IIA [Salibacterium halotolerans]|uniref:PTS system, fructose-specific IIA component/PTS system, nitrogen regulatory IIA component n=1 Tax=Salibacterium halotolerans TaxID=1884432 RepID=A0A1I5X1P8_9BACI|nr:fructose PTS transporter subunit IIA [Salibacterium halotolerans]SFQ25889.1 PTS system, fructose-specific IIA component/PTS system, nitrogen regulatory IIA component [Salibacterium halotolerans]
MDIEALLHKEAVDTALESTDKEGALKEMAALLPGSVLSDKQQFLRDVHARENEGSTGIGFGFAIPHAKSNGVKEAAIAVGKSPSGIEWKSMDGQPAEVIFLIAVPQENAGDDHLKILQQLSKKMMDESFRHSLKQAETKQQIIDIVSGI